MREYFITLEHDFFDEKMQSENYNSFAECFQDFKIFCKPAAFGKWYNVTMWHTADNGPKKIVSNRAGKAPQFYAKK